MNQKASLPDPSLPVSELIEVHKVCQQFEAEWKAGRQPKAAEFLGDTPEPKRSELKRELESIEAEYRQKAKKPTLDIFIETLAGSGLMTRADVQTFLTTLPADRRPADAETLAREMFRQGKLTKFQAQAVFQGKTRGLVVGNYVVLDKLGQGGMGQVYKAQHRKMKRIVAIKMLPSSATKSPDAVKRFQREVEAAAKLSHPNIVTAHDADEANGVNFLVMEHVDGQDLSALVKGRGPLSLAQAVDCAVQAANGLEYAHRQGVVHRDIKPSNLLLDKGGTVKILDMGLARIEDAVGGADDGLTHSGQVMGTLDYMAPEQAFDTHHADARSDIYSLGCTLHYLLTGRAPFAGDSMTQKILAHREQPVPSLRAVRPDVPEWLDGVFQKMLAKRPEDRQQTMGDVMAQLQQQALPQTEPAVTLRPSSANVAETLSLRQGKVETSSEKVDVGPLLPPGEGRGEGNEDALAFLAAPAGKGPVAKIQPHPRRTKSLDVSFLRRFTKRQKIGAAVATGMLFVLVLLGVIFKLRTKEGTLVVEIDDPNVTVQVLDGEGKVQIERPGEKDKLSIAVDPGKHRLRVEKNGVELFAKDFTMASGGTEIIKASWEPPVANPGSQSPIRLPAVGSLIGADGKWKLPAGAPPPPADARPCPADNLRREDIPADELAAAGGGDPSKAPAELVAIFGDSRLKHRGNIFSVGYSGDGKTLVTGSLDGSVCLWDAATGKLRWSFEGTTRWVVSGVYPVSLSRDGKLLATGCDDKSVKLWDAETGRLLWALDKQVGIITSLAFSPDGQFLAVATDATSGKLVVWDVAARRPHRTFKVNASNVRCVAFSPDGKTLAAGSGLSSGPKEGVGAWLQLWEMDSGNELLNFKGHGGMVSGVAFSPDGKTLASASGDATVKLWNTVTATEIRTLDTHPGKVVRVAFSRDGKTVALIPPHDGGPARIWDVGTGEARFTLPDSSPVYGAAFSPDGKTLATANYNGMVRLWDPATGQERPESALLAKPPWWWYCGSCLLAISPNGATLACATHRPQLRLWDLASGKPKAALDGERLGDWGVGDTSHWSATAFSADSRLLATGDNPGTIRIWDLATGKAMKILAGRGRLIHALVFSPDGKILASGSQGKAIELWDLAGGELWLNLEGHQGSVRALAISKDGRRLASGGDDKTIKLWDLTTGQLRATLSGHGAALGSLAFSADGKTLYSAGGTVKFWDLASNEVRLSLEVPGGAGSITLSPDDKTLAIVGGDGTVGLRDARNGRPRDVIRVGPNAGIFQVAFTPDGRHLVTFNRNGTIYVLRLSARQRGGTETVESAKSVGLVPSSPSANARLEAPAERKSQVSNPESKTPPPAVAPFDEKKAKEHQEAWAKHLGVPVEITNSIGMKLVLIPPGEFEMGSPPELIDEQLKAAKGDTWGLEHLPSEGPRHHVRITRPFYLGTYLVTQEEYQRVMGASPSVFSATGKGKDRAAGQDTKRFPVENVSWQDTDEFCLRLSQMREEKSAGRRYRLPSEAQWEYACRAGNTGRCFFSPVSDDKKAAENLLPEYAWFGDNAGGRPHAVGGRRASPWGLYDMYGNVAVWCQDWYAKDYYAKSPADDPAGPPGGSDRVTRGGYWFSPAGYCRSARHLSDGPWLRDGCHGFRVSQVLAGTAAEHPAAPAEPIVPAKPVPLDLKPDAKAWDLNPGSPLNPASLVLKPAAIKGLRSWTLETCASRGGNPYGATGQLSPDDKLYATGGQDGVIRFLDPATGKLRIALVNPERNLTAIAWSPDNVYLVAGCANGAVRIWNVAKGALVIGPTSSSTNQVSSLAWSPDGTLLAVARNGESAVILWDVREARQSAVLQEQADVNRSVHFLAWSTDGKQLMATTDVAVRVWDVAGARLVQTLDSQSPEDQVGRRAAAWSPDGKRIATLCDDGKVKFFDSTYKLVMSRETSPWDSRRACMAWSPDGRHLAIPWFSGCRVLNTASGSEEFHTDVLAWGDGSTGMSWLHDGARLLCTHRVSGTITAVDAHTGEPLWQLAGNLHYGGADICISPDGRQYATAISHDRLYTWDAMQGTLAHDYGPIFPNCDGVAWSKDGQLAVAGNFADGRDDLGARIWDPGKPGEAHLYRDGGFRCAVWSLDGKTLARGGRDVLLWTSDAEDPHLVFHPDAEVAKLAWGPNNFTLATGLDNNKVLILEIPSGKVLRTLNREGLEGGIHCLAVLPDGRLVAASGNGAVSVWNSKWEAVRELVRLRRTVHRGNEILREEINVNNGVLPAGGATIAFATSDGIVLWDADKQAIQKKIGTGPIYSVAWSLPLHRLFAAQDDRLAIYDVPTGELLASQVIWYGPGKHLFLSPEGHVRCSPAMSEDVVYVALTDDGRQVTLRPAEFAAKYEWKNDPEKLRLSSVAAGTTVPVQEATGGQ